MAAHYLLRGDWLASVLAGLTLAMAILPEEFPVVLTVFLALGAWRISRHGVLTRRMPAIEMLGAATVLCVDKTGTLTENRMRVADTPQPVIDVAALACELEPFDPMDRAIVAAAGAARPRGAASTGASSATIRCSDRFLAMCHAWRTPQGALRVAIKGAPETRAARCAAGRERPARSSTSAAARGPAAARRRRSRAGTARRSTTRRGYPFRWVGFVALADPLRAAVPAAVAQCRARRHPRGDDHRRPSRHRAGTSPRRPASTRRRGAQRRTRSRRWTTPRSPRRCGASNVFARVRPEQKLRLVQAYRAAGEVVAMTGDGVNDAPALKAAHIGVAMGRRGTDVAREAAALVLLEDDFGSIVRTVRLGRRIYDNIRNAMRYIVSVHVPTAGMSFLPLALGGPLLLYPVHVVFLEFVIDPACTLVYEAERGEARAMERPPRPPRAARCSTCRMLGVSLLLGATMLAGGARRCTGGRSPAGAPTTTTRAAAFAAIVFANLGADHGHALRAAASLLATLREPNARVLVDRRRRAGGACRGALRAAGGGAVPLRAARAGRARRRAARRARRRAVVRPAQGGAALAAAGLEKKKHGRSRALGKPAERERKRREGKGV